ncbi:MAG: hypothetical protein HKM28_02980 [Flavobacteriaceae bacterium]|nr:hypothetical protein [Flavobacteriaceae bacterium]
MKIEHLIVCLFGGLCLTSCNNGPKVIEANSSQPKSPSGIFTDVKSNSTATSTPAVNNGNFTEHLHSIIAEEVLPTKKYVYVKARENNRTFWLASSKQNITVGDTYYYRNALLKTNFESKEHSRMFDSIYLVSNLVAHDHGRKAGMNSNEFSTPSKEQETISQKEDIPTHTEKSFPHKGSITIAELVTNPTAYEGKTVQLTGKVVKVNPNIMNRNWLHLKDGTQDEYDLVVTSQIFIPEGQEITIKGLVQLNRDFGAGYRYDLILENGTLLK